MPQLETDNVSLSELYEPCYSNFKSILALINHKKFDNITMNNIHTKEQQKIGPYFQEKFDKICLMEDKEAAFQKLTNLLESLNIILKNVCLDILE